MALFASSEKITEQVHSRNREKERKLYSIFEDAFSQIQTGILSTRERFMQSTVTLASESENSVSEHFESATGASLDDHDHDVQITIWQRDSLIYTSYAMGIANAVIIFCTLILLIGICLRNHRIMLFWLIFMVLHLVADFVYTLFLMYILVKYTNLSVTYFWF